MQMSETTMSKIRDASSRFADSPFVAISTLWPSLRKLISRSSQMERSSSTISRWAMGDLCLSYQRRGVARCVRHKARTCPSRRARRTWNFYDELRAKTRFRLNANLTFVRLKNLVDDGEAQPCASGESRLKRLEN